MTAILIEKLRELDHAYVMVHGHDQLPPAQEADAIQWLFREADQELGECPYDREELRSMAEDCSPRLNYVIWVLTASTYWDVHPDELEG